MFQGGLYVDKQSVLSLFYASQEIEVLLPPLGKALEEHAVRLEGHVET